MGILIKNINVGNNDISAIGDGTLTGAIREIKDLNQDDINFNIVDNMYGYFDTNNEFHPFRKNNSLIYYRKNIICDGSTYYDTGFAPYSSANADADFKITFKFHDLTLVAASNRQDVILGCKYEGTIDDQQWPGFYVRIYSQDGTKIDIGGYNYYQPNVTDVSNKVCYLWRDSGNYYFQIENGTPTALSVRVAEFDQNIIIGAGMQTNGTAFRYSNCILDYVKIEYI